MLYEVITPLVFLIIFLSTGIQSCINRSEGYSHLPGVVTLTPEELMDRIRGGWAGQTIGVVYGAPVERNNFV